MISAIQKHAAGNTEHDTIDRKVTPIVFVPGVMGTRLLMDDGPDWDPDSTSANLRWLIAHRSTIVKRLNCDFPASIFTELGTNLMPGSDDPIDEIEEAGLQEHVDRSAPSSTDLARFYEQRGWAGVSWEFYGRLLIRLEKELNLATKGPILRPVFAHGYDWRQTNRDSGLGLIQHVNAILAAIPQAKQVVLVTHSMGGIVVRSALRDGLTDKVAGVVHTVQPSCGAVVQFRRFHTGAIMDFDGPQPGGDTIAAFGLNAIMGRTPIEYAGTQSGLRGPLELLPTNDYPEDFVKVKVDGRITTSLAISSGRSGTQLNGIYDLYVRDRPSGIIPPVSTLPPTRPPSPRAPDIKPKVVKKDLERLKQSIGKAAAFHVELNKDQRNNAHDRTLIINGTGLRTDVSCDTANDSIDQPVRVTQQLLGDGTVPLVSAQFPHAKPTPTELEPHRVGHAECFASPGFTDDVIRCVRRMIPFAGPGAQGGPVPTPPAPAPIPQEPPPALPVPPPFVGPPEQNATLLFATREQLGAGLPVEAGAWHRIQLVREIECLRLQGHFFSPNKCFLLPETLESLRLIPAQIQRHPGGKLAIFAHTEVTGEPDPNTTLSQERAEVVAAYLNDNVDVWLSKYDESIPEAQRWGPIEDLFMLSRVAGFGARPRHLDPVTWFQQLRGLPADGIATAIRAPLIKEYMALAGTTLAQEVEITAIGCGERFPAEQRFTTQSEPAPTNARLDLFFTNAMTDSPPALTTDAYLEWLQRASQLRVETGGNVRELLRVRVLDGGQPLAGARYLLSTSRGILTMGQLDADGRLEAVSPNDAEVTLDVPEVNLECRLLIRPLPDATEVLGKQLRLSAMGLYLGRLARENVGERELDVKDADELKDAMKALLFSRGLPETAPEEVQVDALRTAYGS